MLLSKKDQEKHLSNQKFDWEDFETEAVKRLQSGEQLGGKEGILAPMIKRLLEASLEGELEAHLQSERQAGKANRRNGKHLF